MLLLGISFFIWVKCTEFAALNVVWNFIKFSDNDIFLIKAGIYGPSIIEYIKDGWYMQRGVPAQVSINFSGIWFISHYVKGSILSINEPSFTFLLIGGDDSREQENRTVGVVGSKLNYFITLHRLRKFLWSRPWNNQFNFPGYVIYTVYMTLIDMQSYLNK